MTPHSSRAVLPLTLVVSTMVLTVAACGANADQTSASTSPAPAGTSAAAPSAAAGATTPATTSATSPAPGTSSPATGSPGAGSGCGVGSLKITYADDANGGAAGSVQGTFTFTNTGSSACTLAGFPGVSFVGGGNGTQVGQPATRTDDAVKTRTVEPGTSVKAALRRTQPGNYGDECRRTKVDGFRVYPPSSTESAFVAFKTDGCKSTSAPLLQVGPVR